MSLQKYIPLLSLTPLVIALDQVSKQWVMETLVLNQNRMIHPSIHPYLQITRTINTGIAFGLGTGGSQIFLLLSLIITSVLIWMYVQSDSQARLQQVALAIIIAGAVGNIIDRVRLGHVVDFVHLTIPHILSNVSNFADHAVVIGVIILLLDSFLQERQSSEPEAALHDVTSD